MMRSVPWDWEVAEEGVGLLTLLRPPVNALNAEAKQALVARLESLRSDASIRALVIRSGDDRVFCAGSDLHELAADHATSGSATERTRFEFDMWQLLSGLPQVSIAAVEGHALGSGAELAIACDFRVAGSDARFGLPEIKIGGAPGTQTLARLPAMIGLSAARRMLLFGESVTALDARTLGLVDELVQPGDAVGAALEVAGRMAALPASSIRFLKAALAAATEPAIGAVHRTVMSGVESLFQSPEMHEGIRAFLEKRQPVFHVARSEAAER